VLGPPEEVAEGGIGLSAPLNEAGYQAVAATCCPLQMDFYIHRVIVILGFEMCYEGGLQGFLHFFTCESGTTSFENMKQKLLEKAKSQPLSVAELAKLEKSHMAAQPKAAKTQLSQVESKVEPAHPKAPSMTKSVLKAANQRKPMNMKQLSQLEQMHDKMIEGAAKQQKQLSVKNVMETADESELADSHSKGLPTHAKHASLARMKPHHGLGIAKLLEKGGIKEEVGTQELLETDLTSIPDDFIPKDSPAYQMVMQARMAAQQETLAQQQGIMSEGQEKDDYNDKMKRMDEQNMPGAIEAQGSRDQKIEPQHMLASEEQPRMQQLDEEAEFSGDSLAGDDEEESNDTMLAATDSTDADDGNVDSLATDFDSLAEDDQDEDQSPLDTPQQSYAGDHALMLGSM